MYGIDVIKSNLLDYPSYLIVYESLGNQSIIRRLNKNSELEGLFIYSYDHYLPDKVKQLEDFIKGYCNVNHNLTINDWINS